MKRGPKPGSNRVETSRDKVVASWGETAPDWLFQLADACDASSQRRVSDTLGYSPAAVSNVLNKRYGIDGHGGDLASVEQAVRGAFMNAHLHCPELGQMPTHLCRDWQKKGASFANINPLRVRMYRACKGCPHSRKGENHA